MTDENPTLTIETLERLSGEIGAENFAQLARVFIADTERRMVDLSAAWDQQDLEALAGQAHALSSSVASFGAVGLAGDLKQIQISAKAHDHPQLRAIMARIESTAAAAMGRLREFQANREGPA